MLFFQRVHALPEAFVLPGLQVSFLSEPFHRLKLPLSVVAVDVVEDFRFEHEERSVDPVVGLLGLFVKTRYRSPRQIQATETSRRMDGSHGRQSAMLTMKGEQSIEIDI